MKTSKFNAKRFLSQNGIWGVLIVMVIVVTIFKPVFVSATNIQTLLESESIRGIIAFGVMWAILSKGTDLGAGSVAALVAVVVASLVQSADMTSRLLSNGLHLPAPLAILVGLLLGAIIGAIVGVIIAYLKVPPFIATLGSQLICRALAKMYSAGPVSNLSSGFRSIVKTQLFGKILMIVVVFAVMFVISACLMNKTRFGKNIFAIGGNDQAARVAGINVERNLVMVYAWTSTCVALGGILLAARTGSADPSTNGLNYELDAIAAATVGGTSQTGGVCRVSGVLAGILIMGVINNGLVLLGVDDNMTNVVKGVIIVGAVVFDMRKHASKGK